jgi:RHS repeat-associated protein
MGRILQERRTIGAAAGEYDTDAYNLDGSEASVTDFGYGVAYTYNGAGRPLTAENATSGNNFVTGATYAPPGELAGFTNGTSISGAVTYNSRLQPIQMYFTNGSISNTTLTQLQQTACPTTTATIMNQSYNFGFGTNDNGNVASIANCINTNRIENFTYDSLNRIGSGYSSGSQWGETYTIDAWGNLTNRAEVSGKSNYEPLNTTAGTNNQLVGYTYDTAGNMTVNGSATFTYDAENRLIWTNGSSGYRYIYDGDGERVEKCVAATATTACPTGAGTGTLYWRGISSDPLTETDAAGNVENTYVFFAGQRVARVDSAGAVHYYFSDHLGTHAVVENATGTACEQDVDYYPYGGEQSENCSTPVAQNYKFNGKERDAESGLDNFGARYNTSNLGRFMTPDWAAKPVNVPYANFGNPQSLNLYAYTENNPSTMGDPDGHVGVGSSATSFGCSLSPNWGCGGGDEVGLLRGREVFAAMEQAAANANPDQKTANQQAQATDTNKAPQGEPTVSVTTDLYTNQAKDQGYAGAQLQLTATVKGDNSVAYNWQQTVTQSDSVDGHKPNVPFNDASPDTHMYWSAADQKKAMDNAAKQGATTIFADAPQRFGGVPFTFHATTSLIGIGKDGTSKVLWTATWGVKVTTKGSTLEPLKKVSTP